MGSKLVREMQLNSVYLLARPWFQLILFVTALAQLGQSCTILATWFKPLFTRNVQSSNFRLIPISTEDTFYAGSIPPNLPVGGTLLHVTSLQVLQFGEKLAKGVACNTSLDMTNKNAALIYLSIPVSIDGFKCPVEPIKDRALLPLVKLQTLDDGHFVDFVMPPWASVRVERYKNTAANELNVAKGKDIGEGWFICDLKLKWWWFADIVAAQSISGCLLLVAVWCGRMARISKIQGLNGWGKMQSGWIRRGKRCLCIMFFLQTLPCWAMTLLNSYSLSEIRTENQNKDSIWNIWQTYLWGDVKGCMSIAVFYISRLVFDSALCYFLFFSDNFKFSLDAVLYGITTLHLYHLGRRWSAIGIEFGPFGADFMILTMPSLISGGVHGLGALYRSCKYIELAIYLYL